MIRSFDGHTPKIHPTAFISEAAYVVGEVEIGPRSSVWPGAVIRGDHGLIKIGSDSNIQDNSVIHSDAPATIEDFVTIGHRVVCHAKHVGSYVLLGNGCVLNDAVVVENRSIVAAGAVVLENRIINSGTISIDGEVVNDLPPKQRNIAMVFQSYALYPHMTVFDNMAFGLKLEKRSKDEINERVQEAARILQIEEYLQRKPKQLSGGQRQRVAIGRAITRKPKVFLFDEPLSNLDAALRVQMRVELAKLHNKPSTTCDLLMHYFLTLCNFQSFSLNILKIKVKPK